MGKEKLIWSIVFVLAGVFLGFRALSGSGMAKNYVEHESKTLIYVDVGRIQPDGSMMVVPQWVAEGSPDAAGKTAADSAKPAVQMPTEQPVFPRVYAEAQLRDPQQTAVRLSWSRTIGTWVAALLTLFIFSLLYKDNPFYKFAESVVIGVSAAYVMVNGFWTVIVPNLIARLAPLTVKSWAQPGLSGEDLNPDYWYIVPLILGVMLLWRLAPKGQWIARWPLALFIGVFAGLRLVQFIHADFLSQINSGIVPLIVFENGKFDFSESLKNTVMVFGVLACLVYFFFSFEHKGSVGKVARVGIWILMITFGAMFGYTVMGRITLLAARLEFLFNDWLWLIDPTHDRSIAMLWPLGRMFV
jgi:hypothetical protein